MGTSLDINLCHDFADYLHIELACMGYDLTGVVDPTQSDDRRLEKMLLVYYGVQRRWVSSEPRQILKSKDFSCSSEHHNALAQIERIIQDGDDLAPYLSRKIKMVDYNDPLLNDWGIHHLHLGTTVESDGFMNRTGPLLYCRFEEERAYFIAILPHGSWTTQKLVTIMHQNWPESLSQFRARGIKGVRLTDEEIKELRRKNANYCLEVEPGVAYFPPGGGTVSAGFNLSDRVRAMHFRQTVQEEEQKIIDMFPGIEERAKERGKFFPDPAVLKLRVLGDPVLGGTFCVIEDTSEYLHPLNIYLKA